MSATLPQATQRPQANELLSRADVTWHGRQASAVADMAAGARLWRLAVTLGWYDIRLRYRGSVLGPFWLTLSTAVMVVALGVLYSALFKMQLHDYLPYLAVSLVMWTTLNTMVSEACTCFLSAEGMIRSMRMPYTLYAERLLVRNLLVLLHNLVVLVLVFAWFRVWPGMAVLEAIPGLLLWMIDAFACCLLLGALCARFRDIPPIIASVMQIAFFVSPILWKPELLSPERRVWLPLNPFFTLLEVVRAPMMGEAVGGMIWLSALGFSVALVVLAWVGFVRVRNRLAFWV